MKKEIKFFIAYLMVWISQNLSIPFWMVGHIHLSINVYEDIHEILMSLGMNVIVAIGFVISYLQEKKIKMIVTIFRGTYILLLSYNPCDVFNYFNVEEMHGLNATDCAAHDNTTENAYIAGWSNFVPKESGEYTMGDKRYVFINLSRCNDDIYTMGLIMHELMHHSFFLHDYNMDKEEEMITWAEEEAYEVFGIIKPYRGRVIEKALKL